MSPEHPFQPLLTLTEWQRQYLNTLYICKIFTKNQDFQASAGHYEERRALIDAGYIIPLAYPASGWQLNPRALPQKKEEK